MGATPYRDGMAGSGHGSPSSLSFFLYLCIETDWIDERRGILQVEPHHYFQLTVICSASVMIILSSYTLKLLDGRREKGKAIVSDIQSPRTKTAKLRLLPGETQITCKVRDGSSVFLCCSTAEWLFGVTLTVHG